MTFELDGLCMEPISLVNASFLAELRNDLQTLKSVAHARLVSTDQVVQWIKDSNDDSSREYFIFKKQMASRIPVMASVGLAKIQDIDFVARSAEIGIDVYPTYRGKGIAQTGYRLLFRYCFDCLNLHRVWLRVLESNEIGLHIYSKLGFIEEGRLREAVFNDGKYQDVIIMSLLDSEYRTLNA